MRARNYGIMYLTLVAVFLWGSLIPQVAGLTAQDVRPDPPVVAEDGPKAVITDRFGNPLPESTEAGEVLYFSANGSRYGDKPRSVSWRILPAERMQRSTSFRTSEFGPLLVVPTGTKSCTIEVQLIVAKGDEADVTIATVIVKGSKPDPTPGPTPGPDEPVPTPSGLKAKLKAAFQQSPPPTTNTQVVAQAFRDGAAALKGGQVADLDGLLKITTDKITTKIGFNEFINWVSWRNTLTEVLASEKISLPGHVDAWIAIADLLEGK